MPRKPIDPEVRFWKFVRKPAECWYWTGGNNGRYGVFSIGGKNRWYKEYAHRWSYSHFRGEIPAGKQINHLCEVTLCVNPAHLEPVTPRENVRYGNAPAAKKHRQTHCIHSHEFTSSNTYIKPNGTRGCRECLKLAER